MFGETKAFSRFSYPVLNFPVQDIGAAVDGLAECGVQIERYPQPCR